MKRAIAAAYALADGNRAAQFIQPQGAVHGACENESPIRGEFDTTTEIGEHHDTGESKMQCTERQQESGVDIHWRILVFEYSPRALP